VRIDAHHHVWDLDVRELLAASYREVVAAAQELTAKLSSAERDDVFGETAARWYGIG
jgi:L-fuconolactonase